MWARAAMIERSMSIFRVVQLRFAILWLHSQSFLVAYPSRGTCKHSLSWAVLLLAEQALQQFQVDALITRSLQLLLAHCSTPTGATELLAFWLFPLCSIVRRAWGHLVSKQHLDKSMMQSGFSQNGYGAVASCFWSFELVCACFKCAFKKMEKVLGSVGNRLLLLMLILLLLLLLLLGLANIHRLCS